MDVGQQINWRAANGMQVARSISNYLITRKISMKIKIDFTALKISVIDSINIRQCEKSNKKVVLLYTYLDIDIK